MICVEAPLGVLAALLGWAIARLSRGNLDLEAEGLKHRGEELARA